MSKHSQKRLRHLLHSIYGEERGEASFKRLAARLEQYTSETQRSFQQVDRLYSEQDVILITYGDLLKEEDQAPLRSLLAFWQQYLREIVNTIHILPFFPYSSDDGFSVIDYTAVDPELGNWEDVRRFATQGVRLMFDAVINHISAQSDWFLKFIQDHDRYRRYFYTVEPETDLSLVVRPRALPLLTPVETAHGTEHVWTTFSADQIDLNYQNPDTLLDVIDVLLFYIEQGADVIRLDAIAYLWKEVGTSCIHLPQTHAVVQLMRAIVDEVAPGILLITETNVPHDENMSYFGDGSNEAHLVYNFSMPPLIAHAILSGSAIHLAEWAATLDLPSAQTTFFNFTASHDGVGVRPAVGILAADELQLLLDTTVQNDGQISSKTNSDGSTSPYELNISYFDLLNAPDTQEEQALQVQRFLVSQAILLAMRGIPGIYMHSLLGSRNFSAGVSQTGLKRSINREKLDKATVEQELSDSDSLRYAVFSGYSLLLAKRIAEKAFHPNGTQEILHAGNALFTILRCSPDGKDTILALHNVSDRTQTAIVDLEYYGLPDTSAIDMLGGREYQSVKHIELKPYQVIWLKFV